MKWTLCIVVGLLVIVDLSFGHPPKDHDEDECCTPYKKPIPPEYNHKERHCIVDLKELYIDVDK